MICFIGGIKVTSVASGSNVQIGATLLIYLTSSTKVITEANFLSPGDSFGSVSNILGNPVNSNDPDVVDTPNNNVG
jgi:spore germination protein PA